MKYDVDGMVLEDQSHDGRYELGRVRLIGEMTEVIDVNGKRTYRCLANIGGMLCIVELVRPEDRIATRTED